MKNIEKRLSEISKERDFQVALVGLPHDVNSSFMRGAALAPKEIRKALFSDSTNLFTETGIDLGREDAMVDVGDVTFSKREDVKETIGKIEAVVSLLFMSKKKPVFLGGDHFVTYPVIRALGKKHSGLTILHFDAHPDIYDSFNENRYSHASPFARIMEEGLISRLISVGIRTLNDRQREQAKRFGVEIIEMREISIFPKNATTNNIFHLADEPLYISFDMDVLDPAFAPGVSHHEPGGMTTRQAIDFIHSINAEVVGADVVELNPKRDFSGITAAAAAKIVKEIAGMMI